MGITEIVLLILGIGVFVASFVLPEKKERLQEEEKKLGEEQIRELVEAQMKEVRTRVADVTDETITYAVEKTERSLERVTNEKIMAVSEYSDTVLEAIHKNHEEVLFLYDMLNNKHDKMKDTAVEMERKANETLQMVKDAEESAAPEQPEEMSEAEAVAEMQKSMFTLLQPETVTETAINDRKEEPEEASKEKSGKKGSRKRTKAQTAERNSEIPEVDLSFASAGEDGRNNNEKILALHKEGKSNMAIARELGLGIGEVKLVIDLFKGV